MNLSTFLLCLVASAATAPLAASADVVGRIRVETTTCTFLDNDTVRCFTPSSKWYREDVGPDSQTLSDLTLPSGYSSSDIKALEYVDGSVCAWFSDLRWTCGSSGQVTQLDNGSWGRYSLPDDVSVDDLLDVVYIETSQIFCAYFVTGEYSCGSDESNLASSDLASYDLPRTYYPEDIIALSWVEDLQSFCAWYTNGYVSCGDTLDDLESSLSPKYYTITEITVFPTCDAPCGNDYESEVIDIMNAERDEEGTQALVCNDKANGFARHYSKILCEENSVAHNLEAFVSERAMAAGIDSWSGELTAGATQSPEKTVMAWRNNDSSKNVYMNPSNLYVGVGVYRCTERNNSLFWTTLIMKKEPTASEVTVTCSPTSSPTLSPTEAPTSSPTLSPTEAPSARCREEKEQCTIDEECCDEMICKKNGLCKKP